MLTFFKWFETKSQPLLKYVLIAVILFQSNLLFEKYQTNISSEFIIFNKSRHSILAKRTGKKTNIAHSLDSITNNTMIKDYLIGSHANLQFIDNRIKNVYQLKSKKLLVIDSLGIYSNLNIEPEIVWLINSPNINLQRLIEQFQPKIIVADASNYKSHVKHWQKTSNSYNINFHYTVRDGAFIEKL